MSDSEDEQVNKGPQRLSRAQRNLICYHPDPEINARIQLEMIEAECIDMASGYPPRWWKCPDCGSTHNRGHFGAIGCHRCLRCAYIGGGGVMAETKQELDTLV